ncbi:MAG: oxygen-independent coproporphyrinogen III oxidase [Candidatus Krumholzibacteriia bacterium]
MDERLYDLVQKYDRPGPRYTSYPTAPEWRDDFGPADCAAALADAAAAPDRPLALYVHVPFCEERCAFCGCNVVVTRRRETADPYLDRLERELDLVADRLGPRRGVTQLHWGGGTPNFLDEPRLRRLMAMLRARFTLAPGAEVALEIDPVVSSPGQVRLLRELGFNRISLGVQDLDWTVLQAVNRRQPEELTRRIYGACRDAGFAGVNLDLIYGLPHQRPDNFGVTVTKIIALQPDRVALFSYAHMPWLKKHQAALDETALPDPRTKFALFHAARRQFLDAGYEQVGMDHFARPGDELAVARRERRVHRNFMGYTVLPADDLIGFGITAISEVAGRFVQNEAHLAQYYRTIDAGRLPAVKGIVLDADDKLRAHVISTLMCNFELRFAEVEARFGLDFAATFAVELAELAPLAADGLIELSDHALRATDTGRLFIRNVCMPFDARLRRRRAAPAGDAPRFSRTV